MNATGLDKKTKSEAIWVAFVDWCQNNQVPLPTYSQLFEMTLRHNRRRVAIKRHWYYWSVSGTGIAENTITSPAHLLDLIDGF